jgi:hypothetical protein
MDRFAVYRDISPTYVLFDRRTDSVVALFVSRDDAERTARRLNDRPPRLASLPLRALARRVTDPTTRFVVRPAFHDFERIVVDQWTDKIVWGPSLDMRVAERVAASLNNGPADDNAHEGGRS